MCSNSEKDSMTSSYHLLLPNDVEAYQVINVGTTPIITSIQHDVHVL